MKAFVSFVVVTLVVVGSALGLHVRKDSQASALRLERQAETIAELTQKLESLGERLESIERSGRETRGSTRRPPSVNEPAVQETAEAAATAAEAGSATELESSARVFTQQLVASLGTEGENQFRDYVRQVYLDERDARREREAAEAEERRKEFEELGKGPYGKYNRRVNTLGKQLGMDDRQKQHYHDLLASYHSRLGEMRKAIDPKDQASRERFREDESAIQSEFDAHVARLLNQQQAEDYAAMHPVEKSVAASEGGAVLFKFGERAIAGEGAMSDVMVRSHNVEGTVDLIGAVAEEVGIDFGVKVQQEAAVRAAAEKLEQIKLAPPAAR